VKQGPDGTPIVKGVTLYLPDKRVILAIETKDKHEEMTKIMRERKFLEISEPATNDKKPHNRVPGSS
jgi:hypothetical protein